MKATGNKATRYHWLSHMTNIAWDRQFPITINCINLAYPEFWSCQPSTFSVYCVLFQSIPQHTFNSHFIHYTIITIKSLTINVRMNQVNCNSSEETGPESVKRDCGSGDSEYKGTVETWIPVRWKEMQKTGYTGQYGNYNPVNKRRVWEPGPCWIELDFAIGTMMKWRGMWESGPWWVEEHCSKYICS